MGLGTGVRGGRNPHFPYPLLNSPLPASHPFPPTFFYRPCGRFVIGQSCINSLLSKGKKEGSEWGKKEKCDLVRYFAKRGERVYRGREYQVISRAGKGEFQTQLLSPPTPPPPLPHLFTVLYYPRSPDFVLWHAQFNNTSHNTLLTHGKIVAAGTKISKITR